MMQLRKIAVEYTNIAAAAPFCENVLACLHVSLEVGLS